ncbi:ATP-dependent helicase HrpA [Neptunomonas antarctica]|uniref:ATP-dependent helicase HrpA n=2 Tax=Neptunomonas antarctica TaxID=619304 RepID=A0A1N7NPW1_9GAMM|nr:ATP-dependent RNA helicase HrpA [Neptunomonas antarctica]SIT00331.1 ATP-dependent helicase HrpA [Neptunomonas antarctica]
MSAFIERLDTCLTMDQPRLHNSIRKMLDRIKKNQPIDEMRSHIESQIDASQKRVELRRVSIGTIHYPELPVADRKEEIKDAISKHQVVVIAGETGSGKTTQLPKICLELGYGSQGLIGHTQPRRLAARTVATRIAEELQSEVGAKVGYQVRFTDQVGEYSLIKLMTDGILLAETQHDPLLRKYQVIIIDEAHERSLNIDFLLGYIKRILPQRPDLKLIITSATIDLERFSEHFGNAPIIQVSGRTYPVDVLYRPLLSDEEDQQDKTIQQGVLSAVEEITDLDKADKRTGPRDILIFFSGEREIREAAELLRKAQLRDTEIMPLYARLSVSEQNRIFQGARATGRRIVLATNVAETSVTVPNIRYVIDTGVVRISRYSYRSKVQRLPIEAISQASANQRAGRCGRIAAGVCVRLYSEEDFTQRAEFTDAEIQRTNLAAVILQMLNLKLGHIADFPFIDPPDSRFVSDGFNLLEELGAVNARRQMTPAGKKLSQLPVDPRIGRMILEAEKQGALKEVLIIASALSAQDPRERPMDKQQAADEKHKHYTDDQSDFVTLLNLWGLYEVQRQELTQNQLRKYCQQHFLSFMRMREWRDVHRQLHLAAKQLGLKENAEPAGYRELHVSLLSGLLSHIGFKQENKEFLGARNRRFNIFPASALFKKPPKWVMAAEMVETTKLYARMVARIEPEWAEPLAAHLVKRTYLEPAWQKKRAQVVAIEQVTLFGLLIIPKRPVHYGVIDPEKSHQIFIRSALVEGDFDTKGAFFKHNQALLGEIETLEAKSRRKDLLVDEDTLYDFYAQKFIELDGTHIVNGAGFEKWRKGAEAKRENALYLTEADLLQRSTSHVSLSDYPDELSWKGIKLALSYHFEPGAIDDGVSISVPLALLRQLPVKRLEWLVPGMIKEKYMALLKGLPKQRRKNFVPVPDYAGALAEAIVFGDGDVYEAMAHQLLRMSGVKLAVSELAEVQLDDHYRINIKLVDDTGVLVTQSRDWGVLCEQYGSHSDAAIKEGPEDSWGKKGITEWDFGDLAEKIQLRQAGGIMLDAWPMLVDRKDSVELTLAMNKAEATQQSIHGVTRLAMLAMGQQIRFSRSKIPRLNESVLFASKIYTKKELENDIILHAIRRAMQLDINLPSSKKEFENRVAIAKVGLHAAVLELAGLVFKIHQQYHAILKQVKSSVSFEAVTILNDIKSQLENLLHKHYLLHLSWLELTHYPRYMEAIVMRLEKFPREIPRQRLLSDQLQQLWNGYNTLQEHKNKIGGMTEQISEQLNSFRWYLEEYRVSLFAQQLGTAESVSEKRVKQRWKAIQSD